MSLDDKLIVEPLMKSQQAKKEERRKWLGTWPAYCDFCGADLSQLKVFYDAKSRRGLWGLFCHQCYDIGCYGLGTGKGQKYDSKTLVKLEG
jgi:hypothetical protein